MKITYYYLEECDDVINIQVRGNGEWSIYGEDQNCDFGGSHHQPFLGTLRGVLKDVIYHAIGMKGFWSWGAGGDIKKITAIDVPHFQEIAIVKENESFKEGDFWIYYDSLGKDFGPYENKNQADRLGPLAAIREEKLMRRG